MRWFSAAYNILGQRISKARWPVKRLCVVPLSGLPKFGLWQGHNSALLAPAQTNRHRCADPGFRYAPWVAFAAGALALLAPGEMRLFTTPLIVVSTATLIATLKPKHPIFRLLTLRIVLLIGLMSYSLYLWHWSVLSISRWTWGVNPLTAPLQIAAILALGALSYTLVERPLRRSVPRKIYDRINAMSVDPTQHNNQDMYFSNALTRVWFEENPRPEPDLSLPSSGRAIDDEIPF